MIARVSGRRSVTVVPAPGLLAMSMVPRRVSTLRRTTSIPTPRPDTSVTCRAVEKPGANMKAKISASVSWASAATRPFSMARSRTASALIPPPSSATQIRTLAPECRAERWMVALGRFDAVIHAVADEVHQRVVQLIDHALVQFGIGALNGELDLFVQIPRQVVDEPAKSFEGSSDRQHADADRVLAQG